MKRLINILWAIVGVCVLVLIISIVAAETDAVRWRVFSIAMPIAALCFWGAVILVVIDKLSDKR